MIDIAWDMKGKRDLIDWLIQSIISEKTKACDQTFLFAFLHIFFFQTPKQTYHYIYFLFFNQLMVLVIMYSRDTLMHLYSIIAVRLFIVMMMMPLNGHSQFLITLPIFPSADGWTIHWYDWFIRLDSFIFSSDWSSRVNQEKNKERKKIPFCEYVIFFT